MRNKAEDIAMVLRLLGEGRFFYETRENGMAIVFKDYEPALKELEDFFDDFFVELSGGRGADYYYESYEIMVRDWDDTDTARFIESFRTGLTGETAVRLKRELQGKPYHQVLLACYKAWWPAQDQLPIGREILNAREQFSAPQVADAGDWLALHAGEGLSELLAIEIANRLGKLYPKILRRVEKLSALPASRKFPGEIQDYLKESTRCYLFGQFAACLFVCRAAIEMALKDYLRRAGMTAQLEELSANHADGVCGLIKLAESLGRWDLKPVLSSAKTINHYASKGLHDEPPDQERCKDLYIQTRGVLKELYS
jgi:hypothetical protein